MEPQELCAPTHRGVGVAVRREHDHLAGRVVADRFVEQVGEVVALGIERCRAAREVRDRHRRAEQDSARRRSDEIEDVAAVAVQPPHRVDQVRALEAVYGRQDVL